MQKRNNYVDFFKGISCIAVVLIHCRFPGIVGGAIRAIARFAVPFFFSASGYYLYDSEKNVNMQVLKHRLKKTLTLLIYAELFYALYYVIIEFFIQGVSISKINESFTTGKIMRLVIDNSPIMYAHLWYVFALIYCYIFIIFVCSNKVKGKWKNIYFITAFGYYILFSEILPRFGINDIFTSWQISIHNTFFMRALPFVFLGAIVREYEDIIKKISIFPIQVYVLAFIFCLTSIIERMIFSDSGVYLSSIALVLLFWFVSINKTCSVNQTIAFIGNRLSTTVYIIHIAVMNTLDMLYLRAGIEQNIFIIWFRPILVILISLVLSWGLFAYRKLRKSKG